MPYTSHRREAEARLRTAQDAGLVAAAVLLQNRVKAALTGGYTSGAFVTGRVRNSVTHTAPHPVPGGRGIEVGTNLLYALYWELGHVNLYTRRYERQERWRPTLLDSRHDIQREFTRVFGIVMNRPVAPAPVWEAAD